MNDVEQFSYELKQYLKLGQEKRTNYGKNLYNNYIDQAKEMGLLGDSQYRYYMMQLSKSGQRKKETEFIDIDDPSLLKKIVKVHLEDLEYSKKELENLTGLSDNDLETILPQTRLVRPKIRILKNWN